MKNVTPSKADRRKTARNPRHRPVMPALWEQLESRLLLSGNGFLGGTAFVDANLNNQLDLGEGYLAGAQIALMAPGADTVLGTGDDVLVASRTTGADGAYLFSDIAPGNYRLIETPPTGYENTGTQALSQLQPVLGQGAAFIDVSVRALDNDPASPNPTPPFASYLGVNNSPRRWEGVSVRFFGSDPFDYSAGELSVSVGTASPWTDISPKFTSFCVDLEAFLNSFDGSRDTPFQVDIDPLSTEASPPLSPAGLPVNAGRMGYLYNHYPNYMTPTPDPIIEAGAVSIALYELRYDVIPDLSSGNFQAVGPDTRGFTSLADFNTMIALANQLMSESAGKSELILHMDSSLDATVTSDVGRQSFIAKGSYNFGNTPSTPPIEPVPVTIGDFVWNDLNANGVQDAGEPGIAGVTLTLTGTDGLGNAVSATTTTDANGLYNFEVVSGTYSVAVTAPAGYMPTVAGQGTPATDSNVSPSGTTPSLLLSGDSDQTLDFGYYQPVTIGDFVWNDLNSDGVQDAGEPGIAGVTLTLTGTDGAGNAVSVTTTTNANGAYQFTQAPGTYSVAVTNPANYTPTVAGQGTPATDSNGSPSGTTPLVLLGGGSDQTIDFGFYLATVNGADMAATIGFWHNKNGQALIKSLNGGSSSTALGNWLATSFPHLYGALAGANNLAGKTNTQIAAFDLTLFNVKGMKVANQVLGVALACYVTNSSLAGNVAAKYGFNVTGSGLAGVTYNVGSSGAAFGVSNNTSLAIWQILSSADAQAVKGVLYNGNINLATLANTVFGGINERFDIS